MKLLHLLLAHIRLAHTHWAMHEIDPMHADVPKLMLHRRYLEEYIRGT